MVRASLVVEADLNEDGTYEKDITADTMQAEIFIGRNDEMDAADPGSLHLVVNNHDGEYSPGLSSWSTGVPIKIRSTSPDATDLFTGWITSISQSPAPRDQQVEITAGDRMELMTKIPVSLGLMRAQYTGVIIHRLLDQVEGELATNPTAGDSATGWSSYSGGSALRDATGPNILEDPASIACSGGAGSGGSYSGFTKDLAGQRITVALYCKPNADVAVGKNIQVQLADSGGTIVTSSNTALPDGVWTRIEVTGTFTVSGTSQVVRVFGGSSNAASNWRVGAIHVTHAEGAFPRNVAQGDTQLTYYGPFRRMASDCINEVRDNELGGLFYLDGGGTANYQARTTRWLTPVATATIDETMSVMDYAYDFNDRISQVDFQYQQFQKGRVGTVVWAAEMAQSKLIPGTTAANGTTTILAPFGFIARDLVAPVGTTDYLLNQLPDGSGSDRTGSVTVTLYRAGEGGIYTIVNNTSADFWLTKLALRGTPIRKSSEAPIATAIPTGGTNLIQNPSPQQNLTGWIGTSSTGDGVGTTYTTGNGAFTRVSTPVLYGTAAASLVGGAGVGLQTYQWFQYSGSRIAVNANQLYTLSFAMKVLGPITFFGHMGMYWYNSGGTAIGHSFGTGTTNASGGIGRITQSSADGWQRHTYHTLATGTVGFGSDAASSAVTCLPNLEESSGWSSLGTVLIDGVYYKAGADEQYIAGDQAQCAWSGTAYQSNSVRRPRVQNTLEHAYDWNDNAGDAVLGWARHLGERYIGGRERINVTLRPRDNTQLSQMLLRKVSDRVQLVNEDKDYSTKVRGDYYIENVRHRIRSGGFLHETTWAVSPVGAQFGAPYWILGDSTWGVLGKTTRPAP